MDMDWIALVSDPYPIQSEPYLQLMECDDVLLLQRWVLPWLDLMEFEIVPVSPSKMVRELFPTAGEVRAEPSAAADRPRE